MQYVWLVFEVIILIGLSAVYSGLNISFMSLTLADLRRKAKLGDSRARRVLPLREKSHLTLASILYANVPAVTTTSLVIEPHFNGLIAGFASTILLVIFGEILPQAYFARIALTVCAFFAPFLHLTIGITYIFSKPTALLLDHILPKVDHPLRSRNELGMMIHEYKIADSNELDDDEVEIIQGALKLSEKQVRMIMRPIDEVFWLEDTAVLDAGTVDDIKEKGYSRVPIFNKNLTKCYGVLLMKDMVDVDFDENPVLVTDFTLHETEMIGSRTALDTTLRKFFTVPSHLAPVTSDDRVIGVVTVEDLLEEIIGHEIADETDRALDRE